MTVPGSATPFAARADSMASEALAAVETDAAKRGQAMLIGELLIGWASCFPGLPGPPLLPGPLMASDAHPAPPREEGSNMLQVQMMWAYATGPVLLRPGRGAGGAATASSSG